MRRGHLHSERPGLLRPAAGSARERWRSRDAGDGGEGAGERGQGRRLRAPLPPPVYIRLLPPVDWWRGLRKSSVYLSVVLTLQILPSFESVFLFLSVFLFFICLDILWSFTHPHVVSNVYQFLFSPYTKETFGLMFLLLFFIQWKHKMYSIFSGK